MRKNLRSFLAHAQRVVNELAAAEFPDLQPPFVEGGELPERTLAVFFEDLESGVIVLNDGRKSKTFRKMGEEELIDILRHELIHADLYRQGRPHLDTAPEFILECLRRRVTVNPDSIAAFEERYGPGSFAMFRSFLPPPEVEVIPLVEGSGGVLLREKW